MKTTVRENIPRSQTAISRPDHDAAADAGYHTYLPSKTEDQDWNEFLAHNPGGHHVQTSLWGEVKSLLGWEPSRFMVTHRGEVVAGAQMLIRRFAMAGVVGIVSKGPVIASEDAVLARFVIDELLRIATEHGVHCLIVQPPNNGESLIEYMRSRGFQPTTMEVAPTATIQIDLSLELDGILAGMKKKTRRYIRHGLRSGITGREGTEKDLGTFYRLLKATSERHKWPVYSENYFAQIFRVFGQHGQAKLFLTEYEGEAVSSQLLIAFGDTVIAKNSGWSGRFRSLGSNNVLEWISIQWAKAQGYRYYDLEGIAPESTMSERVDRKSGHAKESWSYYKHQYGGRVMFFPKAHVYITNPLGRWVYANFLSGFENRPVARNILNLIRLH